MNRTMMSWWKKIKSIIIPEKNISLVPLVVPHDLLNSVKEKKDNYILWSHELRDSHGFLPGCDSLLFTSLSAVGGSPVNLFAARDGGRWYRTPSRDCFSSGRSGSTVSRDMLLGVLWYAYAKKDIGVVEDLFNFAKGHGFKIGDGDPARVYLTPNMKKLCTDIVDNLGGRNDRFFRQIPMVFPSGLKGYEAHLQILIILLKLHMDGHVSKTMADRIHEHAERNEFNSLFQLARALITDGNLYKCTELLIGLSQFPSDHLPDNTCRSTEYLWEREHDADWYGSDLHQETYSGSDLIFAAGLIELFISKY